MKIIKLLKRLFNSFKRRYFAFSYKEGTIKHILSTTYGYRRSLEVNLPIRNNGDQLPWYTYPCIEYLDSLDLKDKVVFEWGSGSSTTYWSKRGCSVISIEDDAVWYNKVNKAKLVNVNYQHRADKQSYVSAFSEFSNINIVIIDGSHRNDCASAVLKSEHKFDMIIVDNSDWENEVIEMLKTLTDYIMVDFNGFGPLNPYSWRTTIFFNRRLKLSHIKYITLGGIKQ